MNGLSGLGGVNGKPLGIELDALPIPTVRQMLAEAIEKCISLDPRRDDLRSAFVEELAWEVMMPEIDTRKKQLIDAVKESPVWTKIQSTPIEAAIFQEAAIEGENAIDPMDVFDCADKVREVMKEANKGASA